MTAEVSAAQAVLAQAHWFTGTEEEAGPGRHHSLGDICDPLDAMIVAAEASRWLEQREDLLQIDTQVGLWVAPSWTWLLAKVSVGRKDRASNGSRMTMPVRLEWTPGPISIIGVGRSVELRWSLNGMGWVEAGVTVLDVCRERSLTITDQGPGGVPARVQVATMTGREAVAELERLVQVGQEARWNLMMTLEKHVRSGIERAHGMLSRELHEFTGVGGPVFDETGLEDVVTRALLGRDGEPGKVPLMLERCLLPGTFAKVDPVRYITVAIRRDMAEVLRDAAGDPQVGPKVRRVALDTGTADDIEALVAAYRARYPADRLGPDRAKAALDVAPNAMADWKEINQS